MVKNTRKKNIKYKTNKRKTKKIQVGGEGEYLEWTSKIRKENDVNKLNQYLTDLDNDNHFIKDSANYIYLKNIINEKIKELSSVDNSAGQITDVAQNNSNDAAVSTESGAIVDPPGATGTGDNGIVTSTSGVIPGATDTVDTNVFVAPVVDADTADQSKTVLNQNIIDDIIKSIPIDITQNEEIQQLIKQMQSKPVTDDQAIEIKKLQLPVFSKTTPANVSTDVVSENAKSQINANLGTDCEKKTCFDYVNGSEFVIKAPLSIKPQIMKIIEDNDCSVTTTLFDSNGNVASTN